MLSTQFNRDNQYQAITKPSLLAGCIALALLPSAAFAAPATEETVIVEGSATAPDDGENDYSVTSTSAGTKMQMTQRDIPQSVTIVREGANKRGNSSRLTQSFHFFMFEPIFSPVNA
ncbi:hypothetical protein L2V99_23600, partial [Escherichia coli]|uniref:hypothetical protein n=1 Tax=Escherichia coli TaxID=562 RepID=UPI001F31F3B4